MAIRAGGKYDYHKLVWDNAVEWRGKRYARGNEYYVSKQYDKYDVRQVESTEVEDRTQGTFQSAFDTVFGDQITRESLGVSDDVGDINFEFKKANILNQLQKSFQNDSVQQQALIDTVYIEGSSSVNTQRRNLQGALLNILGEESSSRAIDAAVKKQQHFETQVSQERERGIGKLQQDALSQIKDAGLTDRYDLSNQPRRSGRKSSGSSVLGALLGNQ